MGKKRNHPVIDFSSDAVIEWREEVEKRHPEIFFNADCISVEIESDHRPENPRIFLDWDGTFRDEQGNEYVLIPEALPDIAVRDAQGRSYSLPMRVSSEIPISPGTPRKDKRIDWEAWFLYYCLAIEYGRIINYEGIAKLVDRSPITVKRKFMEITKMLNK